MLPTRENSYSFSTLMQKETVKYLVSNADSPNIVSCKIAEKLGDVADNSDSARIIGIIKSIYDAFHLNVNKNNFHRLLYKCIFSHYPISNESLRI